MTKNIFTGTILIALTMSLLACDTAKKEEEKKEEKKEEVKDNTLTATEEKEGWKLLFDGTSLANWRMYQNKAADCWGVKDGEIYCKGSTTDKSDLRADLASADKHENFELSIDWKIAPGGNSGIMYHVNEDSGAAYLSGPEYQLIDDIGFPEKLENWQKMPLITRCIHPMRIAYQNL